MKKKLAMAIILTAMGMTACGNSNMPEGEEAAVSTSLINEDIVASTEEELEEADTNTDTGEMVPVSYSCDKGSISLSIPEDWEYSVQEYDEENKAFSIEIHPKAESEGTILIEYTEWFGVCGTGLVEKDYSLNGMPARMGIYDSHSYWDFIVLKDEYEGYVILNYGDGLWEAEYEEQLEKILSTISLGNASVDTAESY